MQRVASNEFAPSRPPARHIMASLARPGVAYTLRGALYLALTNQTNATPLTRLRGPAFSMPPSSNFQLLTEPEPTAAELVDAVDAFYDALPPIASRCASIRLARGARNDRIRGRGRKD